ncbi:MAG: LLM class flavin-dependent oxidoreductase, partial [Acidimicrobiales bacterium]
TLGFLAAKTERMTVGAMVTCVTHRNIALLGKIIATLDVLSGGRARCGLGVGWFEREHRAYGYRFPPVGERYELLEDALRFLPLLWGSGSPPFEGTHLSSPEAICYPRPLQSKVPILVGGSGERRTLRLVAEHADACNLFGEPETVRRKIEVLAEHCATFDRDPAEVEITQLSPILSAPDSRSLRGRIAELAPSTVSPEEFAERVAAAPAEVHVERFSSLAEAGVQTAIVSLADVGHPGAVADFAPVIDALRP